MEGKNTFTTKEAANYLGISPSTIYRMEKQGLISSIRTPGGQRRFNRAIIERYLRESSNLKAPQNPSQYKKHLFLVREQSDLYRPAMEEPYFQRNSIWIYNENILNTGCIEERSIDLIVTSPPYNVDIKYSSHNDTMSYEDYLFFTREWLSRCYKFLRDDGRFCLNIPLDKNKGGQQSVCADITTIAKQIGFKYHSTIVWNEQNISRRTAWGSWLSATAPYVIAPVEVIVVLYKKEWKSQSHF